MTEKVMRKVNRSVEPKEESFGRAVLAPLFSSGHFYTE